MTPSRPSHPPGRLPPRTDPEVVMMLCTAGHVDHGKTQLVRLLTGCNTDRLKEEQERGLTIELGFAPCFLGGNLCVGIVDVPGHEKLVRNMVAGVSGIGMALLVIAADDGIMPQTIEHLQILELMGVRQGLVALTKIDLVDAATVRRRIEEIRAFLSASFMADAPVCPVSSETGEGYGEFYQTLVERITGLARQEHPGLFRMPIERVFTREGFGAVVSGVPVAGAVRVGDVVEVAPGGLTGRVRGIQRFLRNAPSGGAGQCLALNIPELGRKPVARGQVICAPGCLGAARFFHVRLRAVAGLQKALEHAETVKFLTGTLEAMGHLYLLEDRSLAGGREALATVALPEPAAAAVRDRFILRRPSPPATVGGGEILAVTYGENRPRKSQILEQLRDRLARLAASDPHSPQGIERAAAAFLRWEADVGATADRVARGILMSLEAVRPPLETLIARGEAMALGDGVFINSEVWRRCLETARARIEEMGRREVWSVTGATLAKEMGWPGALWSAALAVLEKEGSVRRRGEKLVVKAAAEAMTPDDRALADRLLDLYEKTAFQSPRPDELPALLGAPANQVERLVRHLIAEGELIRIDRNVVLHQNVFRRAQGLVVETLLRQGSLSSSDFKDRLATSRKYAIAFLEFLDARGVTIRVGNDRKLAPHHEKRLL